MVISTAFARLRAGLLDMGLTPESANLEARELICLSAGVPRDRWFMISGSDMELIYDPDELLARRASGEPLAYILGQWEFYGLTLKTDPRALIPRDDSCAVLELFLSRLGQNAAELLDLCTGTGCLGLAAATQRPGARLTLADISEDALSLAEENIALLNLGSRVKTRKANALTPPPVDFIGKFQGLICNPPYLRTDEPLPPREPELALYGGADGLDFYRAVSKLWKSALAPGGVLCFEVGHTQAKEVKTIMETEGFRNIETARDLQGIERGICGEL